MDGLPRRWRLHGLYSWPGLLRLWRTGSGLGLAWAVVGTGLVNAALIGGWIWPAWWPGSVVLGLWGTVVGCWLVGWVDARRTDLRLREAARRDPALDLFLAARGEYLQGNWFQTEELVAQILRRNPRDVEARLLKATLLRHTGRWDEAREQLRQLQRLEGAGSWNMEIEREWLLQSAAARTRRSSQVSPHATANPLRRAA